MTRIFSRLAAVTALVSLTACSGGKSPTGTPPTSNGGLSVGAASPTLSVPQGTTGAVALTVGRTGAFAGAVTLTAEGLPAGVTATFTPSSVAGGSTTSNLELAAGSSVAVGSSPITIRARGTGVSDATTTIGLTVAAAVQGSVSLALTPATASITSGQTASTSVAITRAGGFTGGVTMTVSGAPAGVTTSLSSANPVTADALTLSVATVASVVPGPYTLTVRANSAGLTEATATYVVTVASPPSNNISWQFCNVARRPIWFAYQDGASGTWQRVTETSPGVYNFAVGQPVIGITTVSNEVGNVVTEVRQYGLSEVGAAAAAECRATPAASTKTATGSVTGFGTPTEEATVSLGTAISSPAGAATPGFTITNVPAGALDLVAVRYDLATSASLRVLLNRSVNVADGASLGALDLAAGTSFAPVTGSVTVTAPNDGAIAGSNRFLTASGAGALFGTPTLSSGAAATYFGVPEVRMAATDLQQFTASQQVGTSLTRSISRYTRGPTTITIAMPADPAAPTITSVTGAPYARATVSGVVAATFNDVVSVLFEQQARSRRWRLTSTNAARTAGALSVTMPDFTAVPGWLATWGLGAGTADVTSAFSGQTGANPDGTPTTGTQQFTIARKVSFTFP